MGKKDWSRDKDIGGYGDNEGFNDNSILNEISEEGLKVDGEGLWDIEGSEKEMGGYWEYREGYGKLGDDGGGWKILKKRWGGME